MTADVWLFSYGTLQQEDVQLATFGRRLEGRADALPGYATSLLEIRDAEVVKAVVTLGTVLGKTVIAEGIETPSQLAQLRALGCGLGQGYLLARPLSADGAAATLAVDRRWPGPEAKPSEFGRFVPTGFGEPAATLH